MRFSRDERRAFGPALRGRSTGAETPPPRRDEADGARDRLCSPRVVASSASLLAMASICSGEPGTCAPSSVRVRQYLPEKCSVYVHSCTPTARSTAETWAWWPCAWDRKLLDTTQPWPGRTAADVGRFWAAPGARHSGPSMPPRRGSGGGGGALHMPRAPGESRAARTRHPRGSVRCRVCLAREPSPVAARPRARPSSSRRRTPRTPRRPSAPRQSAPAEGCRARAARRRARSA